MSNVLNCIASMTWSYKTPGPLGIAPIRADLQKNIKDHQWTLLSIDLFASPLKGLVIYKGDNSNGMN